MSGQAASHTSCLLILMNQMGFLNVRIERSKTQQGLYLAKDIFPLHYVPNSSIPMSYSKSVTSFERSRRNEFIRRKIQRKAFIRPFSRFPCNSLHPRLRGTSFFSVPMERSIHRSRHCQISFHCLLQYYDLMRHNLGTEHNLTIHKNDFSTLNPSISIPLERLLKMVRSLCAIFN